MGYLGWTCSLCSDHLPLDVVLETEADFDLLLNAERLESEEVTAAVLRVLQDVDVQRFRQHWTEQHTCNFVTVVTVSALIITYPLGSVACSGTEDSVGHCTVLHHPLWSTTEGHCRSKLSPETLKPHSHVIQQVLLIATRFWE